MEVIKVYACILTGLWMIINRTAVTGQEIKITPNKVTVPATETAITVVCRGTAENTELTLLKLTNDASNKVVESKTSSTFILDPTFSGMNLTVQRAGDTLTVTIPKNSISCDFNGVYKCIARNPGEEKSTEVTDTLSITDTLNPAQLTADPQLTKDTSIQEGQPLKLTCSQIYGPILDKDPRSRPKQLFWRWQFQKTDGSFLWRNINGALSIFKDTTTPTKCQGERYQSEMTFFPLSTLHSDTTFRCFLVVNMKPVAENLFATYQIFKVNPPADDKPLEVEYIYTKTSFVACILGVFGLTAGVLTNAVYFLSRILCKREVAVNKSLLKEMDTEHELDDLEKQLQEAMVQDMKGKPEGAAPTAGKGAVADVKASASSIVDPQSEVSVSEISSAVESSVAGSEASTTAA